MLLTGPGLLAMGPPGAVTAAPVSAVTVYRDRAHVVRTATVTLSGTQRVGLPRLRGHVEPSSIRVEAQCAEVTHVDVRSVSADAFTWRAVPKLYPVVFRVGRVSNTAPFPLLPGPVDLYRGTGFLGASRWSAWRRAPRSS